MGTKVTDKRNEENPLVMYESLKTQIAEYEKLLGNNGVSREHKDRLFKFIFGNPENRRWTLELYNAVNGTNYKNPDDIQFNTMGQFLYLKMRNDISFIISFEMNIWEHQSSYNPNIPMRFLRYGTRLYEKYIATSGYYEYSSFLQPIPRPRCICFYNGTQHQQEKVVLKLSDAYEGDGDIEVAVTMYNINYGKNRKLMETCKPLEEYSWLVEQIRCNQKQGMDMDSAVDAAVDRMPKDFVIRPFVIANRAEVRVMLMAEYDEELVRKYDWQDGNREGMKEGRKQGRKEINELNNRLIADGRIEDLKKATNDQEYQDKLYKEYFPNEDINGNVT